MNAERVGMKDAEFMLALLEEGKALTTMEIISASAAQRGCGLTPHSRASDLRKRGHKIECKRVGRVKGRDLYEYRLLSPDDSGAVALPDLPPTAPEQIALPLPGSVYRKDVAA